MTPNEQLQENSNLIREIETLKLKLQKTLLEAAIAEAEFKRDSPNPSNRNGQTSYQPAWGNIPSFTFGPDSITVDDTITVGDIFNGNAVF